MSITPRLRWASFLQTFNSFSSFYRLFLCGPYSKADKLSHFLALHRLFLSPLLLSCIHHLPFTALTSPLFYNICSLSSWIHDRFPDSPLIVQSLYFFLCSFSLKFMAHHLTNIQLRLIFSIQVSPISYWINLENSIFQ